VSAASLIRGALGALAALLVLALPAAAAADATTTRPYIEAFGDFQEPGSVAVDESTGDVYVLDAAAGTVSRFDSALEPKQFPALGTNVIDGSSTPECDLLCDGTPANGFAFLGPERDQIAIDNSGGPAAGNLYVADPGHRVVDVFAPSGAYLGQFTAAAGSRLGGPCGVTVAPGGDVLVADAPRSLLARYAPAGGPPTDADFVSSVRVNLRQIAAGGGASAGALFSAWFNGAEKYDLAGNLQYEFLLTGMGGVPSPRAQGVAVDPGSGHLLVAIGSEVADRAEVAEYDASGAAEAAFVTGFGAAQLRDATGVGADGARSRVYVADAASGEVDVYGPLSPVVAPSVATGPVTPLAAGRQVLTGYVDGESAPTRYYFEYGTADCAQAACASAPASQDAAVGMGVGAVPVTRTLSGLQAGTTYHYRLVAVNAGGTTRSDDATFTTQDEPAPAHCANAALRQRQGLPEAFPDCRAYELVSSFAPALRNNVDVLANPGRARAAAAGGAFEFAALGGTREALSVGLTSEYAAVRDGARGWAVHGISPPQSTVPVVTLAFFGGEPRYVDAFTPDLSRGVYLSISLVNEEGPNVAQLRNLYLREDLLQPGRGRYLLLSDSPTPQLPQPGEALAEVVLAPRIVGASTDLSHVYFESLRNLTGETTGSGRKLYEAVDGELHLASVLPASEGGGPVDGVGGQGPETYNSEAVSADGSRVLFTFRPSEELRFNEGRLYLRDDRGTADPADDTGLRVNVTEKTDGAGPGGADPGGEQPAIFQAASADLSRIFFTTTEALTDDAPVDEPDVEKLYRYDLEAPAGGRLTLLSVDRNPLDGTRDGVDGVIDAAADGSYVYFVASNQLVQDRPAAAGSWIFVWHQGQIHQVAPVSAATAKGLLASQGWEYESRWARVSPDGRRLAFLADADSDPTGEGRATACSLAASPCRDAYLYSVSAAGEESLWCASCRPDGQPGDGDADFAAANKKGASGSTTGNSQHLNQALSADGRFVFFTSTERLSPYDENDLADVYELEVESGSVRLLSGGRAASASYFLDASEDGDDVFFVTREALLAADGNQSVDVYDARIGGGFEEAPPPAPPASCDSTASCRPATSPPPADDLAAAPASSPGAEPRRGQRRKHRHGKHRHKTKHKTKKHRRHGPRRG